MKAKREEDWLCERSDWTKGKAQECTESRNKTKPELIKAVRVLPIKRTNRNQTKKIGLVRQNRSTWLQHNPEPRKNGSTNASPEGTTASKHIRHGFLSSSVPLFVRSLNRLDKKVKPKSESHTKMCSKCTPTCAQIKKTNKDSKEFGCCLPAGWTENVSSSGRSWSLNKEINQTPLSKNCTNSCCFWLWSKLADEWTGCCTLLLRLPSPVWSKSNECCNAKGECSNWAKSYLVCEGARPLAP